MTVTVHAVNEAGAGPDGDRQRAHHRRADADCHRDSIQRYNPVRVTFTPNNKGGNAVCTAADHRRRLGPSRVRRPRR